MATYRLKRKTFGLFAGAAKNFGLMKSHFGNIGNAFNNQGTWSATKELGKSGFHAVAGTVKGGLGTVGLGTKGVLGAAGLATAGAIGGGLALDSIGNN